MRNWLLHPDPSTNHNLALEQHLDGTAAWLTQGSTFKDWKAMGTLLWIHGKRAYFSDLLALASLDDHPLCAFSAGSGKSILW